MDKKALPLDEYGRKTAGERYGHHSTSEHGKMAMNKGKVRVGQMADGGAATQNSEPNQAQSNPQALNLNPTSS